VRNEALFVLIASLVTIAVLAAVATLLAG